MHVLDVLSWVRTQGMVQGLTYREEGSGRYLLPGEQGRGSGLLPGEEGRGSGVTVSWEKMSKSKHNGVDPEVIVQRYGADAVRLFMLFKVGVVSQCYHNNDSGYIGSP